MYHEKRNGPFHRLQARDSPPDETFTEEELTNTQATTKLLNDVFQYGHRNANPIPTGESVSIGVSYLCGRLDENEHVLTSRIYGRVSWTDPRLTWDSSEYNGITEVRVDPWSIWTPDLTLYNAVESVTSYDWWGINAVVSNNGTVWYYPPSTLKTACRPNKTGKSHQCVLKTGSWTYDSSLLTLKMIGEGITTDSYIEDCPYTISNPRASIKSNTYEGYPNPYQHFEVTFTIQPNNYD